MVEELAIELERAGDDVVVLRRVLQRARDELDAIVRRPLADLRPETADDLREQVLERGEGFPVTDVATAMRCTPTFVRRARIAAGRDPEHGRPVTVNGNGSRLDHALDLVIVGGLSVRAAAAATGVPRSTLGNHARRAG